VTARRAGLAAVAALLAAVALTAPEPASASSIAYIKEHNVWLSSPDGSVQRQVTTDGTPARHYNWPSQADDGTILAKLGDYFVRMRPDGARIGDPVPGIGSDIQHSGNLTVMAGPAAPRISPDGTRFAYWISARSLVTCPVWNPGCSFRDTDYTVVSRVDRFTAPEEFGAVRDYRDPSWIGNDRLLVTTTAPVSRKARSRRSVPARPASSRGTTTRPGSRTSGRASSPAAATSSPRWAGASRSARR
jgi:hypothetical protein